MELLGITNNVFSYKTKAIIRIPDIFIQFLSDALVSK